MHREERRHSGGRATTRATWLVVILLAVIATCLLIEVGFATSAARAQVTSAGAKGVFAIAGQITRDSYGLYLVDLENATICVYQYLPGSRRLRLMAARTYVFDCRLDDYNNADPLPRDVKKIVEQQERLKTAPPKTEK